MKNQAAIVTDEKQIEGVLTRGVADILPSKAELKKILMSGRRIRLYQGFDPTAPQLHVGSMVGLRKLRDFQNLGHEVIFLLGDGTGQAGDPSGKTRARDKYFSHKELLENAKLYKAQVQKILQFVGLNPAKILFNGRWLNKLRLTDMLNIAGNFTLQQLSERDLFQERMKRGEPVNLREFLYPLLQGYDSVAMDVDLEIGGSDQTFNMLIGRSLMKKMREKEKFVLSTPLLTDAQGRKIGKSEGNALWLTEKPEELYGKIMALSDDIIVKGLEYLTDVPMEDIRLVEKDLKKGVNQKQHKEKLAFEIVAQLHDKDAAQSAHDSWKAVFSNKEVPETITEVPAEEGVLLDDILQKYRIVPSKSEVKRLIIGGGIKNIETGEKITNEKLPVIVPITLKIGKKTFIRIRIKKKKR